MAQNYPPHLFPYMMVIKHNYDNYHVPQLKFSSIFASMVFSKSFGYAIRSILYVALVYEQKSKVQLNEIAVELGLPRYFLAKVMNKLSNEGILDSVKGPNGGFSINEKTLTTPLIKIIELTGESENSDSCVLRLRKCNSKNPCPLHNQVELLKNQWLKLVSDTTISDLLKKNQPNFIRSITLI